MKSMAFLPSLRFTSNNLYNGTREYDRQPSSRRSRLFEPAVHSNMADSFL